MFNRILAVANTVVISNYRNRAIFSLFIIGAGLLLFIPVIGEMAIGSQDKFIQDAGFFVINIMSLVGIMYMGANTISQEFKGKVVYNVLSRVISRTEFLVGKWLGNLVVVSLVFWAMSLIYILEIAILLKVFSELHIIAIWFMYNEIIILTSISILFATFTNPILHSFFLVAISICCHFLSDIWVFAMNIKSDFLSILLKIIYYSLPNLENLNFRAHAIYGVKIPIQSITLSQIICAMWTLGFLTLATYIFERRKLL